MNRELVESATHPDRLRNLVEQLGSMWKQHELELVGSMTAEKQTAASGLIRRDKHFFTDNADVVFPQHSTTLATRLGDPTIEIKLCPPVQSPFDESSQIETVSLPARWFGDPRLIKDWVAESVIDSTYAVSGRRFFLQPIRVAPRTMNRIRSNSI